MFGRKQESSYGDAELDALARERQRLKEKVDAEIDELAKQKQRAQRSNVDVLVGQRPSVEDNRELPLLYWMGWAVANKTRGSARLDLVRPRFATAEPNNLFRKIAPTVPHGTFRSGDDRYRNRRYDDYNRGDDRSLFRLGPLGQGARIKVMRHIDFGTTEGIRGRRRAESAKSSPQSEFGRPGFGGGQQEGLDFGHRREAPDFGKALDSVQDALRQNFKPPEKPWFDFGAGVNLELDEGSLQPTMRLKVKDFFSIKMLPEPMFKVQKRLRLGNSSMGFRVNYELPLVDARNLWEPPARLMLRFDNHMGGLKVGPKGADFDESVLQLGKSTSVRAGLSVDFPDSLPLEEGERLFSWRARRLGIKTKW